MPNDLAAATAKVVDILSPLESEDRIRVVNASLTLLGESAGSRPVPKRGHGGAEQGPTDGVHRVGLSEQGEAWAGRNGVTGDNLEQWYYFDEGTAKLLAIPSKVSKRSQQAIDVYLLHGLGVFLVSGEETFSDRDARDLCEHFGCYDATNHSKIYKAFGNKITGSKSAGWRLTAPGRVAAAALVKEGSAA